MKKENAYQSDLIKKLKKLYPGCIILKNDPKYKRGIPDLVIFYGNKYAFLEVKASAKAKHRPGQDNWIDRLNKMSFAKFIFPENEKEVLRALSRLFKKDKRR